MINKPLVSIITVVFNGDKYIATAIESVKNQTYDNIEYIVVDGDSKDETVSIIKKNSDVINSWISEPDDGLYYAMNKGIKLARGSIIGILNCDDWYNENTVQLVVDDFLKDNSLGVVHGQLDVYKSTGDFLYRSRNRKYPFYWFLRTPFKHPTCFYKKEVYDKIGLFNTEYLLIADYDLMLRTIKNKVKTKYIPRPLTNLRSVGLTSGNSAISDLDDMKKVLYNFIGNRFLVDLIIQIRIIKKSISLWLSR